MKVSEQEFKKVNKTFDKLATEIETLGTAAGQLLLIFFPKIDLDDYKSNAQRIKSLCPRYNGGGGLQTFPPCLRGGFRLVQPGQAQGLIRPNWSLFAGSEHIRFSKESRGGNPTTVLNSTQVVGELHERMFLRVLSTFFDCSSACERQQGAQLDIKTATRFCLELAAVIYKKDRS